MVPPHEVLSEEESAQVLAKLGTPADRIPKILEADPGLKTDPKFQKMRDAGEPLLGRVVRIRRPSATAGTAIAYRLIVDSLGAD
ncbi:MAG: DNA-directed RNA polymerase subunit RpoH/Rpb5 C-terminal domain-containing protein [Thermoplasmata archaeon]